MAASIPRRDTYRTVVGWLLAVAGAVMAIVGIVAWVMVGAQLKAQHMTVPDDANSNAGKTVAGPFTAWSMQETIGKHANNATDGLTYAELGDVVNQAKEEFGEDSPEAAAAQGIRTTALNASLLRSSLFTSILAFGVSLLAFGTGAVTLLGGTVILRRPNEVVLEVTDSETVTVD